VLPIADAQAELAKLNADQKQLELGKRAINRYGCFSCHDIKGFEKAQAIGTDLSEEGTKLVTRLDFAFVTGIPHSSKLGWFKAKLHDPRVFDQGRVLPPLDKLRMPNYDFTEREQPAADGDHELPAGRFSRRRRCAALGESDNIGTGRTLVHRRNCVGCHIIEGSGGDYLKLVADPSLEPPMLTPEGRACSPTGSMRSSADRSPSGRGSTSGCRPSASTTTTSTA
jgi:hypothetical protein